MRKTVVVLLSCGASVAVGLAMIGLYSSCGNTNSDVNPNAALGQFFNQSCSGGNCLTLQAPNAVPADGNTVSGFRAQMVDGSGVPITGQEICFAFEDPGVAVITEPTDACGLTDLSGSVSGQFRDGNNTGSFQLVANAPGGFALRASKTISFFGPGAGLPSGGGGCRVGADCPSTQCSANPAVCPAGPCCLAGGGSACTTNAECASPQACTNGTCGAAPTAVPTAVTVPTPVPNGGSCTNQSQCVAGSFCGTGDCALPPANGICGSKRPTGACCTFGAECISSTCAGTGLCG